MHTPLRAAVLGSALVIAIGWPGLRGYGNKPDNATIHPLDYGSAVLTLLVLLWAAALGWSAWRLVRRGDRSTRRQHRPEPIEVRLEHLEHPLLADRLDARITLESGVVVGHEREPRVRQPCFARQCGFGVLRHVHEVPAHATEPAATRPGSRTAVR